MGRRKQSEPSKPSESKKVNGTFALVRALLMNAHSDTPREIVEWCKTSVCKSLCYWCGIDINDYRKKMLSMALGKNVPQYAPAPSIATAEPVTASPVVAKKSGIVKEPRIAVTLPDAEYGPLFQNNYSGYIV